MLLASLLAKIVLRIEHVSTPHTGLLPQRFVPVPCCWLEAIEERLLLERLLCRHRLLDCDRVMYSWLLVLVFGGSVHRDIQSTMRAYIRTVNSSRLGSASRALVCSTGDLAMC